MKKVLSILISALTAMSIIMSGCGNSNNIEQSKASSNQEYAETEAEQTIMESTTKETDPPATAEPELSETCDMVLASGYDGDDYYELVANESEDYQGVKDEVGVIKNNKWLLEPTIDMPLVEKKGNFFNMESIYNINSLDVPLYKSGNLMYIGNGCFYFYNQHDTHYYYDAIYNAKDNKVFAHNDPFNSQWMRLTVETFEGNPNFDYLEMLDSENYYVVTDVLNYDREGGTTFTLLNTNTMESKEINIPYDKRPFPLECVYPVSENIFAAAYLKRIAFFDIEGNQLFDSSEFTLETREQSIVFKNDECSFNVKNDKGTIYQITIDTTGKVINSEQA